MTVLPVTASRHSARHARRRFQKVRDILRIPKPVNAALDWAQSDPRAASLVALAVGAFIAVAMLSPLRVPVLCVVGGAVVGGSVVGVCARIVGAVRREEIKRLKELNEALTPHPVLPVDTSATAETQRIRRIGDER